MTREDHLRNKSKALEEGNERSYQELREKTHGRFSMDTGDLRRELFIEKLLEWGIITEEQKLDFDVEFHTRVEGALNNAWEQFREANKPKLAVVKKESKLLDARGQQLS